MSLKKEIYKGIFTMKKQSSNHFTSNVVNVKETEHTKKKKKKKKGNIKCLLRKLYCSEPIITNFLLKSNESEKKRMQRMKRKSVAN